MQLALNSTIALQHCEIIHNLYTIKQFNNQLFTDPSIETVNNLIPQSNPQHLGTIIQA
jgi:hypothetical protein